MSVDTALTQPAVTRAPAEASQRRRGCCAGCGATRWPWRASTCWRSPSSWRCWRRGSRPTPPEQTDFSNTFAPPGTPGHLLGTDDLGRDVLSRILLGVRASLQVAVLAVATALAIGVPLGLVAGYFRAAGLGRSPA